MDLTICYFFVSGFGRFSFPTLAGGGSERADQLISSIRRIGTIARSRTSAGTFTSYWSWRRLSYTSSRLMSFIVRQCFSGTMLTKVCCG